MLVRTQAASICKKDTRLTTQENKRREEMMEGEARNILGAGEARVLKETQQIWAGHPLG